MNKTPSQKKKAFLEIILFFLFMMILTAVITFAEKFLPSTGPLIGVLFYLFPCVIILFYVSKVEKTPFSSIGLIRLRFQDIPAGLLLGFCMFVVQQIPLLIMKMDYSAYAMTPEPGYIIATSLYCFLCVGFAEELIFRGFILHRTLSVCPSKILSVVVNILFFYAIHWSSMQFVFGEFYNLSTNVIILCIYLFRSKRKSLFPLMIAHGFYDTLTSVLLPVFVYLIQ
ncbi:MAG: CPBP family intramembrane metalloprotease [Lachnospiraceae bacterium]|jgi:membrane protease YdiL (CAAX protease family)|nr:CPBP family intramembrane metalloprotease [Lachnospiraceae bacterium]